MHYSEDLRHRQHKVEDLREEKEDHGLREVPQNADHGKGHTREIAEGITHEDFRGELVVLQEAQGHENERDDDGQRENVLGYCLGSRTDVNLDNVVKQDEASDNKALTCLDTIDTGVDVDRVRAENCEKAHIDVIEEPKVENGADEGTDEFWHNYISYSVVCHKQRECGNRWNYKFMPPFQVDNVINKT